MASRATFSPAACGTYLGCLASVIISDSFQSVSNALVIVLWNAFSTSIQTSFPTLNTTIFSSNSSFTVHMIRWLRPALAELTPSISNPLVSSSNRMYSNAPDSVLLNRWDTPYISLKGENRSPILCCLVDDIHTAQEELLLSTELISVVLKLIYNSLLDSTDYILGSSVWQWDITTNSFP